MHTKSYKNKTFKPFTSTLEEDRLSILNNMTNLKTKEYRLLLSNFKHNPPSRKTLPAGVSTNQAELTLDNHFGAQSHTILK